MIRICCLILIGFFTLHVNAQQPGQLPKETPSEFSTTDEGKVDQWNNMGWTYLGKDLDSAMYFASQAQVLAQTTDYANGLGKSKIIIGYCLFRQGETDSARVTLHRAVDLLRMAKDSVDLAWAYMTLSTTSIMSNQLLDGLEYAQLGGAIRKKIGDTTGYADAQRLIGIIHSTKGDLDKALVIFEELVSIYSAIPDSSGLGGAYSNLGTTHFLLENYEKALRYHRLSLSIRRQLHLPAPAAVSIETIGAILVAMDSLESGEKYLLDALEQRKAYPRPESDAFIHNHLGMMHYKAGNTQKAREMMDLAYSIAEANGIESQVQDVLQNQLELEAETGNYRRAYQLLNELHHRTDSLWQLESRQELEGLLVKYETRKKEQEIERLNYESELSRERVERATAENALKDEEISQQRTLIAVFGIAILFIILLSYVIWFRVNSKRQIAEKDRMLAENLAREMEQQKEAEAYAALIKGQEEERIRVARELHDSVGIILSTAKLQVSSLETAEPGKDDAGKLLDDACDEVRRIAHDMMPGALVEFGLIPTLEDLASKLRNTGQIDVQLVVLSDIERYPSNYELTIYRVIQEAINNAIRHGQAASMTIQFNYFSGNLNIMMEDNGQGFETALLDEKEGIGFENMRSRLGIIGGSLHVDSEAGEGTTLMVNIPLPDGESTKRI